MPATPENTILAFKKEPTRGTFTQPASADADIKFSNISYKPVYSPVEIRHQGANHSQDPSVMTKTGFELSADFEAKGSGAAGTAPALAKIFEMLGYKETISAGVSVAYQRDKTKDCGNTYSATIQELLCDGVTPSYNNTNAAGIVCTSMTGTCDNGGHFKGTCSFIGKFVSEVQDQTAIEYTGYDTTSVPNHISTSLTIGGDVQQTNTVEYTIENGAELETNFADSSGSGYVAGFLTTHKAMVKISPYYTADTDDAFTQMRSGATAAYADTYGTSTGNIMAITGAAVQRQDAGNGEFEGGVTRDLDLLFTGDPGIVFTFS